jgi:exodeoxyribonuclease VII small subunit
MTEPRKETVPASADIAKLSFEEAMAELDRIVRQIEEGRGELDQAITAYERGVALKRHCESKLREAEARIEKITLNAEGGVAVTAFDS